MERKGLLIRDDNERADLGTFPLALPLCLHLPFPSLLLSLGLYFSKRKIVLNHEQAICVQSDPRPLSLHRRQRDLEVPNIKPCSLGIAPPLVSSAQFLGFCSA